MCITETRKDRRFLKGDKLVFGQRPPARLRLARL